MEKYLKNIKLLGGLTFNIYSKKKKKLVIFYFKIIYIFPSKKTQYVKLNLGESGMLKKYITNFMLGDIIIDKFKYIYIYKENDRN